MAKRRLSDVLDDARDVRVELLAERFEDRVAAILGAEDDVDKIRAVGVRHERPRSKR